METKVSRTNFMSSTICEVDMELLSLERQTGRNTNRRKGKTDK